MVGAQHEGGSTMSMIDERRWHHDPWDDPDVTDALVIERPRKQRTKFKWLVSIMAFLALAGLVGVGLGGLWYTEQVNPKGDPGDPVTFTVNADDTLQTISDRLEADGLITKAWVFRWYVDHHGGLELTPGYYALRPRDHMGNIMRILRIPPSQTFTKVTFPEGYTYTKMGVRLEERVPRLSAADFGVAATDGTIRSKYLPDGVNTLEGLLFPDTYQVSNGETEAQVVQRMVKLTERVGGQEGLDDAATKVGYSPYQVLIVASIIEREAAVPEDRAKIARVIYNRLFFNMPLEVDATLYYQQDGSRPFSELKALDTPYNTYLHTGLPPTPISNPGRASIEAALNPATNPSLGDPLCVDLPDGVPCVYLYYVIADSDGRHAFAATYEQHLANVEKARELGLL
jgi:UPF0755 protein